MAKELTDSGYLLTPEERKNHIKVYAGPGAGKTHFLIQNIRHIVESDPIITTSELRKILCITYTNTAADELAERLSKITDRVTISTIHSFIYNSILKPYHPLLKRFIKEEFNIGIDKNTLLRPQIEGRSLLFGHRREDIFGYLRERWSITEELRYSRSAIQSVELSTEESKIASKSIELDHVLPLKDYIWNVAGVLSHDELLVLGLGLVERFPIILYGLRVEYPFIFVDEFQDTNPVQTKLLQKICAKSSIVGIIGDIAQSIYTFAGAKPRDFATFSMPDDTMRTIEEFVLTTNRRSKDNIVQMANYIRQKDTNLAKQSTHKDQADKGKVIFYIERANPKQQGDLPLPIQAFIDSGAFVLTRTWAQAFQYIRGINPVQAKVLNDANNLYTYRLGRDFRKDVAEYRDIPWIRALAQLVGMEEALGRRCIASALKTADGLLDSKAIYSNPALLREFLKSWQEIVEQIDENESLLDIFLRTNRSMKENADLWGSALLIEDSELLPEEPSDVDKQIHELINMLQYRTGRALVNEVFLLESKYMTVHQAKGREFEKVLVYMEPSRFDEDASYLKVLADPDITGDNEYDRLLYVAMSRAISELGIHIKTMDDFSTVTSAIDRWCERNEHVKKIYDVQYL